MLSGDLKDMVERTVFLAKEATLMFKFCLIQQSISDTQADRDGWHQEAMLSMKLWDKAINAYMQLLAHQNGSVFDITNPV